MENLSGQEVKGYQLEERIGAGGFGAVYRARQSISRALQRDVAVKVILPELAEKPDFIRRFETEAQIIARLEHLHITPLYDYWRDPEGAYLVMRYLRGGSLRQAIDRESFSLEGAAQLLDQVGTALAAAHRRQVIHRDIKPSNILLDEDGNAYLTDFGIAKDLEIDGDEMTNTGTVMGSLDYLAPEQARSESVTPQTDIYSLGVTLYEMLTGEHPYPGLSGVERLFKHINEPVPQLENLEADVLEGVNAVIQKATSKDPAGRFADVLSFASAFREAARLSASKEIGSLVELLTPREQEVLKLMIDGLSNPQIADKLIVEVVTVKWYVRQIYKKLNVRSRMQAIVKARDLNLVVAPQDGPTTGALALPEPRNPYKGLRSFQTADEEDYFGREKLVRKLVGRLLEDVPEARFLALVGPSGSGKSSLAKAGLIPALWKGELPGSDKWYIVDMIPGAHPFDELEVALTRVAAQPVGRLKEHLQGDNRGLLRAAQLILPDDGSELLLVIDQFEEVFTLLEDDEQRRQFLDILTTAVLDARSRVRVVVTLRADFYDRPLQYPNFGALLRDRVETVLPLSAEELERAIKGPASLVGMQFEEGLVATIVNAVHYQPGALPLLQYALTELFELRQGRLLTHAAYQEIGGAVGALARRAEGIYLEQDEARREAVRQMFLRLVTLGEGAEDTRRRICRAELLEITDQPDAMDEVIDTFAEYRLLSLDNDPATREPTVEVAHEAILREWERLRSWLNESRADIALQRQLAAAAAAWDAAGREASFLLRGARLEQFEAWREETDLALTPVERAYLDAGLGARKLRDVAEAERQAREARLETRSRNFLRALVGVFAAATVFAVVLSIYAFSQRGIALEAVDAQATQEAIALSNAATAQAGEEARATQEAIAVDQAALAATAAAEAQNEADRAATQQAIAEGQARLATSRELSQAAIIQLDSDPELSMLLAYQALNTAYTRQAVEALRQGMQDSRVRLAIRGNTAIYSMDGERLFVGTDDGTIQILDAETGEKLFDWSAHETPIFGLELSSDGMLLASSGADAVTRIWDAASGVLRLSLTGHTAPNNRMDFSPDGSAFLTANEDRSVKYWDIGPALQQGIETVEAALTIPVTEDSLINQAFFIPQSDLFMTIGEGQIRVFDRASGEQEMAFEGGDSSEVSPDGAWLAVAYGPFDPIEIWDLPASIEAGSKVIYSSLQEDSGIFRIAFSPDGTRIATTTADQETTIWNLAPGESEALMVLQPAGSSAVFGPDGSRLITSIRDQIKVWDVRPAVGGEVLTIQGAGGRILKMDYSPDGRLLGTAGWGGAYVWDTATGELALDFPFIPEDVWSIAFSPDGQLIATGGKDNIARIISAGSGEELFALSGHADAPPLGSIFEGILQVRFSPDGSLLASGGADGFVKLWDVDTGREVLTLQAHPQEGVPNLVFSPDGQRLAATNDQFYAGVKPRGVVVWDIATEEELFRADLPGRAWGLAFSPDSSRLVTSGQPGFLIVWDTENWQELSRWEGFNGTVGDVHFSPDGETLLTEGGGPPRIWDFETAVELVEIPYTDRTQAGNLSPDGRYVAIGLPDGSVQIYTLDLEELLDIALERMTRWFTPEECQEYLYMETCPPAP